MFASTTRLTLGRAASAAVNRAATRQMSVITLSDEEAIEKFRMINSKSVLYFTASWCPPCKGFTPLYEEMSTKYKDVAFGKIDIDQCQDAALEYEIRAVPTFVIFDGEVAKDKFSGADPGKLEDIVKAL